MSKAGSCRFGLARWRAAGSSAVGGKQVDELLDGSIALDNLLAIELIGVEIQFEREQVFGPIVAGEGSDNFLDGSVAAVVAISGEPCRVALTIENAAHD
ncbi:MAG: hypothetical protein JO189_18500 [Deltaproteobacteria bacterium]|nr:hypothetical protein [Deltaproteobacteria bacterium]